MSVKKTSSLIPVILRPGNALLVSLQELLNKLFTPAKNPLYYLGALTYFLLWIVFATGAYLFIVYDMSPDGAYESVEALSQNQFSFGSVMRSLHRYASDGLVFLIGLHVFQVLFSDRFRKHRWVAWVTGVLILPTLWFEGVTGYFMVWDDRGQIIAVTTAELLDILSLSSEPLSRMFAAPNSVNSAIFMVVTYLHLAIPCLLLILAWIHCIRITRPLVTPPRFLGWPVGIGMLLLSLMVPATSGLPANLTRLVGETEIDWFYLWPYPLIDSIELAPMAWLAGGFVAYLLFVALPWLVRPPKNEAMSSAMPKGKAVVDEEGCTGCELCLAACPFEAISLTSGSGVVRATISPSRCGECGICVSSCAHSAVAIDWWTQSAFNEKIASLVAESNAIVMIFICERSLDMEDFLDDSGERVRGIPKAPVVLIPCIGALGPAVMEYATKAGAKGIVAIGCRAMDCHYRAARSTIRSGDTEPMPFHIDTIDNNRKLLTMLVAPFESQKVKRSIDKFIESLTTKSQR